MDTKSFRVETDDYVFRRPETEEENIAYENFFLSQFRDNPRYRIFDTPDAAVELSLTSGRAFEMLHGVRYGVYDKKADMRLCAAYRLVPPEVGHHDYPDELQAEPAFKKITSMNDNIEARALRDHPEYFAEGTRMMRTNGLCVDRDYRGRGLLLAMTDVVDA